MVSPNAIKSPNTRHTTSRNGEMLREVRSAMKLKYLNIRGKVFLQLNHEPIPTQITFQMGS